MLYTTLSIYVYLINLTGVKTIYSPQVDLLRPILSEILIPKNREQAFNRVQQKYAGLCPYAGENVSSAIWSMQNVSRVLPHCCLIA